MLCFCVTHGVDSTSVFWPIPTGVTVWLTKSSRPQHKLNNTVSPVTYRILAEIIEPLLIIKFEW
jgi:hypothetical protein